MKNAFFLILFALAVFAIYLIQAKYTIVMAAMGNGQWTIVIGALVFTIAMLSVMLFQTAQRLRNIPAKRFQTC